MMPETATATACLRKDCTECPVEGHLLCVHTPLDLARFYGIFAIWLVPFLAGMIIGRHWAGLSVWGGLAVIFFEYAEARVLCRHCPHYAEPGFFLRCHANWGLPKIPALDPSPLSRREKGMWLVWVAVLFLYFIPFFWAGGEWGFLGTSLAATVFVAWYLQRHQCRRCYNLSCPVNRVPEAVRKEFFKNYPAFARAWGRADESAGCPRER